LRGAIYFNRNDIAAYLKELGASIQYSSDKLTLVTREQALKDGERIQEIKRFFAGIEPDS